MKVRRVRTCPMCGLRFSQTSFTKHVTEDHDNPGDLSAIAYTLWKYMHRALNRGG